MMQDPVPAGHLSPLIYTKVHIPRTRDLLSRPRLLDYLHENIHRKLVLVCAGPGYGKTSLLVDFARDAHIPVCWYTLDRSDEDPRTFLDYLIEAVRVRFPSFGARTRALLEQDRGGTSDLRSTIGVLVNEFVEQIPEFVAIVLDDYHTVEAEEGVNRALDTLLQYLPEHVHMIVLSRSIPPLSLTRLTAYGEAVALGADVLRFTVEEASMLLQRNLDLHLSETEARQLVEESEGWITAILLRAQAGQRETRGFSPRQDHVYTYLADEVLSHLSPELQIFLKRAAIPRQVDGSFCDALLERDDSAQLLRYLERRNLFLIPLEGGWYRFHGLFRDFLLGEARKDRAGFTRLHRRAALLWRERGEPEEVVEHLLQAAALVEATEEMEALAQGLFERSRFRTLVRWIEALPEEVRWQNQRLLLYLGKAYIPIGQADRARACFVQAGELFARDGDGTGQRQALADLAVLERMQGNYRAALQTAQAALAGEPPQRDPAVVDLHRTISVCLLALGNPAGAEVHARAAVTYSPGTGAYNEALAYLDLGYCLYTQGRLVEADAAYQQALDRCREIGSPDLLANILNNLAMRPFLHAEFGEALDLLERALAAAQTSLSAYLQALVRASLGDLYRDMGDSSSARWSYQQGLEQARHVPNAALVCYLLDALGNLARQEGAFLEARQYLEQALEAAGTSDRDRSQVNVSLALLEAAEGQAEEAMTRLAAVARREEGTEGRLESLRAWVARSIVEKQRQHGPAAREALRRAAALAETMGVVEPFLAEGAALLPLLQSSSPRVRGAFLQGIVARLQSRPRLQQDATTPGEPRPSLRLLALGPGRVFRRGREITAREWGYRIPRELFFYLFFHNPAHREQVGLVFWPDRNPARMSSAFHAALYQARRAVDCQFATFQEDVYAWNQEVVVECDVVEFERLLNQAANLPPGTPDGASLLEQAISLYGGDFLEDCDREWCNLVRENLRSRYLQTLLLLGEHHLQCQDPVRAQQLFQDSLRVDPFCEESYRGLMRCHALAGERALVVRVYRRCRRYLAQELHVEPSEETVALYRTLTRKKTPPHPS
jgi:ATP/maltotriose-dependent transcriptional regulator MalT/DNA-binding SARP family transcriptional activator